MDVRHITAAVIASLALASLAACSGTNGATPAMPNGAGSSVPAPAGGSTSGSALAAGDSPGGSKAPYCAQAPASMVSSALRLSLGKQVTTAEGPVSVCAYLGRYMVMVRYQSGENARQFTEGRKSLGRLHQAVTSVHGLGDQAYFASAGSGQRETSTLAARKGPIAVFLTAPKPLAPERSLMTRLLSKL
ncbi:MAG: hypothetical protein ACRDMI_15565 [Streptosporangiaceae bacterium]